MSVYGILKGYAEQENETARQTRDRLSNDELTEAAVQRKKDKADLEAANRVALAARMGATGEPSYEPVPAAPPQAPVLAHASGAAPGTTPASAPKDGPPGGPVPDRTMAGAQGVVAPPTIQPRPMVSDPPYIDIGEGRGPVNPAQAAPSAPSVATLPKVTVTGKRDDDFNSVFAARREHLLKNGRSDLAAKVDQEWNQHTSMAINREVMKAAQLDMPENRELAQGELQAKRMELNHRILVLSLAATGNPVTAATGFAAINKLNDATGIWNTGQQAGSFAPGQVDKSGSRTVMLMDTEGKPITADNGQPMTFSQQEWARLTGAAKDYKFEKLGKNDTLLRTNSRTGTATKVAEGKQSPTGPTPEQQNVENGKQIKLAHARVDEKLQRDNQTGLFLNSSEEALVVSARAKIRSAELVQQGVPGDRAGVQALDEEVAKYRRAKAIAGDTSPDRLPKGPTLPPAAGTPTPQAAPEKDYSHLWMRKPP